MSLSKTQKVVFGYIGKMEKLLNSNNIHYYIIPKSIAYLILSYYPTTKTNLGILIVGHVDAGKSTTAGRLVFELGGMTDRDLEKLRKEAQELGKEAFLFAFYLEKLKNMEYRCRFPIQLTPREFFTDSYHYTINDGPNQRYSKIYT